MGLWDAVSDYDYYDAGRRTGIERTCTSCGEPAMVDRDEMYEVQVFCPRCVQEMEALKEDRERNARTRGAA